MGKFRGLDKDEGWIKRRFAKIEKQMREDRAAKRLASSTVAGTLAVKAGGKIAVPYPEDLGTGNAVFIGPEVLDGIQTFNFRMMDPQGVHLIMGAQVIPPQPPLFPTQSTQASMYADLATLEGVGQVVAWLPATGEGLVVLPGTTTLTSTGTLSLNGGTNGVQVVHTTTASAANAFLDPSTNRLSRSTSSLRYKQDVEDAEVDPAAVLDMQPRTWRDKAEVEKDPDTETRYVGFIAEELHELGLGQFVVYDADGDPEAISYDRLTVALLAVLKDQEKRIAALEADDT